MSLGPQLFKLAIGAGARLPLPLLHGMGAALGLLSPVLARREYRVARGNIARCFPALDGAAQRALVSASLREAGASATELAAIWGLAPERALALVREVRGEAHLRDAIARGGGVLIAAPHLGCWELLNLWLAQRAALTILYRSPTRPEFENLLINARTRSGATALRAEPAAVRQLVKRLRAGEAVGILPDQRARHGEGVDSMFFGQPTRTMSLLSRLAARTGASVLIAWAERLPHGAGYRIHLQPASAEVAADNLAQAVAALDRDIERAVRLAPAQYQWTYKRFRFWVSGMPPSDD